MTGFNKIERTENRVPEYYSKEGSPFQSLVGKVVRVNQVNGTPFIGVLEYADGLHVYLRPSIVGESFGDEKFNCRLEEKLPSIISVHQCSVQPISWAYVERILSESDKDKQIELNFGGRK